MQTAEVDYLDSLFTVNEQEPSTLQELINMIGEDACVENINSNLRYRNKYPRVYGKASDAVAKDHGFARKVVKEETKKDGTVKKVLESVNDHLRRFVKGDTDADGNIATPAPEENKATLLSILTNIANSEPLYVKGERTGGGGKVSAAALASATGFIAEGEERVAKIIEYVESNVPNYKVGVDADGQPSPESLARAIMALSKKAEADAKAAQENALKQLGA